MSAIRLPLALIPLISLAAPALAGYTPDRPVFDYAKRARDCSKLDRSETVRGRCGAVDPVFNSFVNTPSYGDERAFVDARLATGTGLGSHKNVLDVGKPSGQVVVVRLYVNNGANEALGSRSTAHGTRVRLSVPTGPARALRLRGYVSADDATPSPVSDTVDLVASDAFELESMSQAMLYTSTSYARQGLPLSEDVLAKPGDTSATGVLITNTGTPGEFEAGFDKDAQVQVRLRVVAAADGSDSDAALIVIAALAALGGSGAARFAVKRGRAGEPVGPFLFGAGAMLAALVATVMVIVGETDTGVAGYVLAVAGLVLAVVQLSRSP